MVEALAPVVREDQRAGVRRVGVLGPIRHLGVGPAGAKVNGERRRCGLLTRAEAALTWEATRSKVVTLYANC